MDEVVTIEHPASPRLFNSALEVGIRVIVILDAFFPRSLDLSELALFDYFVVHTADIGGPASLHPEISSRNGEYFIRRRLIEDSLELMRRVHMVNIKSEKSGIKYEASDEASAVLDLMDTPYNVKLKESAQWLAEQASEAESIFVARLRGMIDKWAIELGASNAFTGG